MSIAPDAFKSFRRARRSAGTEGARSGREAGCEFVDTISDRVSARGIKGLLHRGFSVDTDELTECALQATKEGQVDVDTERRYILPG